MVTSRGENLIQKLDDRGRAKQRKKLGKKRPRGSRGEDFRRTSSAAYQTLQVMEGIKEGKSKSPYRLLKTGGTHPAREAATPRSGPLRGNPLVELGKTARSQGQKIPSGGKKIRGEKGRILMTLFCR